MGIRGLLKEIYRIIIIAVGIDFLMGAVFLFTLSLAYGGADIAVVFLTIVFLSCGTVAIVWQIKCIIFNDSMRLARSMIDEPEKKTIFLHTSIRWILRILCSVLFSYSLIYLLSLFFY